MEESIQAWMIFLKHLVTLDSEESFFCSNFAPLKGQPTKKNTHHFGCFFTFFSRRGNVQKRPGFSHPTTLLLSAAVQDRLIFFFRAIFFFGRLGVGHGAWDAGIGAWNEGKLLRYRDLLSLPVEGIQTKWWWLWKNPIPQECPNYEGLGNHGPIFPRYFVFFHCCHWIISWMVLSISSKKGCWKSAPDFWSMNCSTQFFYHRDTSDHHPYRWSILQKLWRFISWFDDFVIVPDEGFIHFFACLLDSSKIGVFTFLAFQEITKKL